jgi:hypothetical protein
VENGDVFYRKMVRKMAMLDGTTIYRGEDPMTIRILRNRKMAIYAGSAAFLLSLQSVSAQQLEMFVTDKFDWNMDQAAFEKLFMEKGFEWVSDAKKSARHSGSSYKAKEEEIDGEKKRVFTRKHPKIGKMDVGETIARFADGTLSRMDISVFNRGDDSSMMEKEFEEKVDNFAQLITKITGEKGVERLDKSSAVRNKSIVWKGKTTQYMLNYSAQKGREFPGGYLAEFINLKVAPKSVQGLLEDVAARDKRATATREGILSHVVKDASSGDVYIKDVPMVDQGTKGYCAVASAERVLRYYGLDIDQHEMAQISGASAGGGTSPEEMTKALKSIAGRLKLHLRVHEEIEDYKDFEKMVKDYNRVAKRSSKKEIPIRDGYYLSFAGCYHNFDAESLSEARAKGSALDKFQALLDEKINEGIPILWSLFLGVFPEKNIPQPTGGHMRLIIGYNKKTGEVIYTDSWGAGHEMKRMKIPEAYAMTTGLRTMVPFR